MKRKVRDLLRQKDLSQYPFVGDTATIEEALQALEGFDSGAVLIMHGPELVGIFSERDFARHSVNKEHFQLKSKVFDAMTRKVIFVNLDYKLEECLAIMSKMRIRHLPVVENGSPVALLSMRHIMEALIEEREFMLEELTKYICGSNYITKTSDRNHGIMYIA